MSPQDVLFCIPIPHEMGWFLCFNCCTKDVENVDGDIAVSKELADEKVTDSKRGKRFSSQRSNVAISFTFRELAAATQNFKDANLIGEGGFGSVYKGRLESGKEQVVAVKQLNLNGLQGHQEFIMEALPLLKDRKKFVQLVDPLLQGRFSIRSVHHVVAVTAMCLQEQANFRPLIGDIVVALEYLASQAEMSDNVNSLTAASQKRDEDNTRG
ncbi:hypothetical protein CTI12_AA396170 [Artemisia annua]|uniref:Protein kinase domain-containing protein n=1 Tax=Artemisia annua TaxID=35608 RepID=A0A2U1MC52_ARTAN|nr:hypothetical protein CTI12_AA396170 [Artemisia annua]